MLISSKEDVHPDEDPVRAETCWLLLCCNWVILLIKLELVLVAYVPLRIKLRQPGGLRARCRCIVQIINKPH